MANVKVDTRQMQEIGNDIIKLSLEFNEAINMLYSRISSINSINNSIWVGNGAEEFVRRSLIEKKQYVALKDQLLNCGKFLNNAAYRYEESAKRNRI